MKMATWKTAAIVRELENEIEIMNKPEFKRLLARLEDMERLISVGQLIDDEQIKSIIRRLKLERSKLREYSKIMINLEL